MDPADLWRFLPIGYLTTIAVETPILMAGLSSVHPMKRRIVAGLWLTACTYPIVVLVLPILLQERFTYILVAEIFAPLAECVIFAMTFHHKFIPFSNRLRDFITIVAANVASFLIGIWLHS